MICVILLVIDIFSRMGGKPLYFIHASRFIITAFGLSSLIFAGSEMMLNGTRGYMTVHLFEFVDDMYTNLFGWHVPSKINIFKTPTPTTKSYFMFMNVTFIEHCILLILILTWGIMKLVLKKEAMMSKGYHLVKSLFLVFFISFMFPLIFWGGQFWRQHAQIRKDDANLSRSYFGYIVNWIFMFFWFIVALFLVYSMIKTSLDPLDGDKTVQANYEQPDFVHERNELTDAARTIGLGKDCSTESVSHDFSYMHQEKAILNTTPVAKWYNFVNLVRWFFFMIITFSCFGKPKTAYVIFFITDLFMFIFTIVCLKSFMNAAGILIIIEEFCLTAWHVIVFFFFEETDNFYKEGTVKTWMIIVLILYLIVMLIEIILLFLGGKLCFAPKKNASNIQQAPNSKKTEGDPHFKVELPDSAKVNLNTHGNQNAI